MVKIIEFVCTGNSGRSKPAELNGIYHVGEIGEDKEYKVTSSGTSVDDIQNDRIPNAIMIRTIKSGKQRALYSAAEVQEIDKAIRDGNDKVIRYFFGRAADRFKQEEHAYRAEALKHFGIEGVIGKPEQTIARPDTIAVLSMAESNNQQVKRIYRGSGYDPVIDVLSRFATGNPDAPEIPNAFGKSKEDYFKAIEVILEHVPIAIDRLIN
jgi:protein-tyrosine-phosphatase